MIKPSETIEGPIKQLPNQFRKEGFDFKILLREGNVAMLRKTKPGFSFESYEVVRIQSHNGYTIDGVEIEPAESIPNSTQWGRKGWTYSDIELATRKFDKLREKLNK